MIEPIHLDGPTCQRIAEQVAAILRDDLRAEPEMVTAAEVARRFSVSTDHVYRHAERLGAVRLGDGDRAPIRLDLQRVRQAWSPRQTSERSEMTESSALKPQTGRRRHGATGQKIDLLPVHRRSA